MRKHVLSLLVVMVAACLTQEVKAENRFNVITFGEDGRGLANRQQFYQWLDEWGATIVHTPAEVIAGYVVDDSLGFVLSGAHFWPNERIYFIDTLVETLNLSLSQSQSGLMSTYTHFEGLNDNLAFGYKRIINITTGISYIDEIMTRPVLGAKVGSESSGRVARLSGGFLLPL
jgi:hypothetical protein